MDYVSRYNSQEEEEMNNIFMFLSGSANRIVAEADMSLIMDVRISNYIIKTLTDKLQENKKLLNLISHIDLANISKDDVLRNKINVYIKVGNLTESLSLSSRIAKPTKDDKNIREFIEKTLHSIEKIFSINLIN
jgi:thiamine pyrophosphate-dependent acetolactate synthase large subunit-like protein